MSCSISSLVDVYIYVCICMYYVCMFVGILIINVVAFGSTNSSRRKENKSEIFNGSERCICIRR